MPESAFKRRLVAQARIQSGHRVLDLGCGTATLTLLAERTHPKAEFVGLDGDLRILKIAKKKALKVVSGTAFHLAMSYELPYADKSFDRVLSSLFFHHLSHEDKGRTLNEVYRVLGRGGELHVADFGKPQNVLMRVAALPWRAFDGLHTTADNVGGQLPLMFREAGFTEVCETARYMTLFGTLALYQARKA